MNNSNAFEKEVVNSLGNLPFIYYGSYQIQVGDISYFSLYYEGSIPCLKMIYYDTLNLQKDKAFPLDDAKIKVFINPRSNQLKEILIQFKVTSFLVNGNKYTLEGILDVNLLHIYQYAAYPNLTSHGALQQICKNVGLGFNTNIDDTNDQMTWINPGDKVIDFMEDIVDASYKSDSAFVCSFIDFYYNFNLVDLAKELSRNIDNDYSITDKALSEAINTTNTESLTSMIISNDESVKETNLFFEKYRIINNSTAISLIAGYTNNIQYYNDINKELLIFNIESITSKNDSKIILKGQPQDEEFFNLNNNYYYLGKIDTDNCHINYNYSFIQNEKNLIDLEKIGLEIIMRSPNYSIYKFQKIKVFLSNQASTPSADIQNARLSGEWLVIDIKYNMSNGNFSQIIKLVKRELDLSVDELSNEAPVKNITQPITSSTNPGTTFSTNPLVPTSATLSSANTTSGAGSILTMNIWRMIYTGKINPRVMQVMYQPTIDALNKYGMNTAVRICTFLSQVNIESAYLKFVTELSSGEQYDNRTDLGNNSTDGPTYKGRGLLQITGYNNYKTSGQFLNEDFINDPTSVAADNATHIAASDTPAQLSNCVEVSIRYWINGSSWGNLNSYTDDMDLTKSIDLGIYSAAGVPNTQTDAKSSGFKTKKNNNFATDAKSSNDNLYNFTLISFGINGGYNGYSSRIDAWNNIRQYFQ